MCNQPLKKLIPLTLTTATALSSVYRTISEEMGHLGKRRAGPGRKERYNRWIDWLIE